MTSSAVSAPFILKEAVLKTNRLGSGREVSHDIRAAIVDFNIYEGIHRPYTTAQVTFADTKDTLSSLDIQGGEYIDFLVESAHYIGEQGIRKRYHVTKIEKGVRAGENAEVVLLHCIDVIGFRSFLKNVNVLLEGTPLDMIVRIANEYLDTDVLHNEEKFEQIYKIIPPNMHPTKCMSWITRKAITTIGMPHFLFASFGDDALRYLDLEDILNFQTVNATSPFTFGFTSGNLQNLYDFGAQTYNISSYSYADNHDIAKIIDNGMLNGHHAYFDVLRNKRYNCDLKASEVFASMYNTDLFNEDQQRVPIAPAMTMDNEFLEDFESRKMYNVTTGGSWGDGGYTSYTERAEEDVYKSSTINTAIRNFLSKDSLTWKFSGKHFASLVGGTTDGAHLLGKKLRVVFSKADPDGMTMNRGEVDMKKSGDYIVTLITHHLNKESYNITCTGSKLATLNTSTYAKGIS